MQSRISDSAYRFEEEIVDLSRLKRCPVRVTLQTKALLERLAEVARRAPENIEPITVAVLGNVQYIANGHLRVKALKAAGHDSAMARVVQVRRISDIVRLQIELNSRGTVNPLGMIDAVQFLQKHGAEHHVSSRYVELAKKVLYSKARETLEEFLASVCKNHENVELPIHVIEWLVKFETEQEQNKAILMLINSLKHMREPKFAFPTPDGLEVILYEIKPKAPKEKKLRIFAGPEEPRRESSCNKRPGVKMKEAMMLIRNTMYDAIIKCNCGSKMLIDIKTMSVASVNNDRANKIIRLNEEKQARPVYAISDAMLEFLNLEYAENMKIIKIRSKKDLEAFALRVKDAKQLRLVILSG